MPQATQAQAWAAWTAAQNSKGAAIEAPQQATPEPVGEVVAESILGQWMTECGVYLVEKMGHQWASQAKQADLLYLVKKALSYTRPAPGVPEGFAQDGWISGINSAVKLIEEKARAYADEFGHDDDGFVSFGTGQHAQIKFDNYNGLIELADEVSALAAAQAKGGQHAG